MILKTNRAPLLSNIKLFASFHHHIWIQTGITVRKRLSGVLISVTLTFDLDLLHGHPNGKNSWNFHDDTMRGTLWKRCHRRMGGQTSLSMNRPTTWSKSGRVSLVSSSCLYKTQPERALAQVCHTRIDALSPDEYQSHLLYQNSHHSHATYPKWLNH